MKHHLPTAVAALSLAFALTGCGQPPSELRVQGNIVADLDLVVVPPLAVPAVNLDAGFPAVPPDTATATTVTMGNSGTAGSLGLGTFATVASVSVHEGDSVTAGQPLLQLDDQLLQAALRTAQADATLARAQTKVIDAATADAKDAQDELAEKRADVVDALATLRQNQSDVAKAIRQLTDTRKDLLDKRADALAGRSALRAAIKQVEQALASLPATPTPPGVPSRAELEAQLKTLNGKLAQVDAGLAKLDSGLAQLNTGLAKAKTGRTKLAAGVTKATTGLHKLDDAADTLADGITQLDGLRRLAQIAAETADLPVELARLRLAEAAVAAPTSGTVVSVANVGAQLAPGATLVRLQPATPAKVTTWLSQTQVGEVCPGDAATVRGDWMATGETVPAQLTRIAPAAEFPPSSQATDEVHLTRAFLVEFTTQTDLPAGAPVTISIQPCRATTSGNP